MIIEEVEGGLDIVDDLNELDEVVEDVSEEGLKKWKSSVRKLRK